MLRVFLTSQIGCLALATLLATATPSNAGLFKCDSHTIVKADYTAMKSAAVRTAKSHVLDWRHATPCMNPGRGRVWIDAVPEPQADGSVIAFSLECLRQTGPWKCEVLATRSVKFSMPIDGSEQQFALQIPPDFAVSDVRPLVARAFEKAPTLKWQEECGAEPRDPGTDRHTASEETLGEAFTIRHAPYEGEIDVDEAGVSLVMGFTGIQFSLLPPRIKDKKFVCWFEQVTVA